MWPIPDGDVSVDFLVANRVADIDASGAPHSWVVVLDRYGLTLETTWRVVKNGKLVITSNDHQQMFGLQEPVDARARALDALAGAVIQRASCAAATSDLFLE